MYIYISKCIYITRVPLLGKFGLGNQISFRFGNHFPVQQCQNHDNCNSKLASWNYPVYPDILVISAILCFWE